MAKKSANTPLRVFADDGEAVPLARRRTAIQKNMHLDLMLSQVANFCPVIPRNSIAKNSTSINSIWQSIRAHYGFQSTGSHFLDFSNIKLEADEIPEDLYQRLMSFIEDSLLVANGNITHHGDVIAVDEEMTLTLENMVVLTWLSLVHRDLPNLVKQRCGTELRSRTLASLKLEISQALDSLLAEIETATDAKVLRATASHFRRTPTRHPSRPPQQSSAPKKCPMSCPLCKQAGRNDLHYLSACPFLPSEDRAYLARSHLTTSIDEEADLVPDALPCPEPDDYDPILPTARIVSRRVSTKQSPHFKAFYKQRSLTLTLDTGAETSMIKLSTARLSGAPIKKSTQQALRADG